MDDVGGSASSSNCGDVVDPVGGLDGIRAAVLLLQESEFRIVVVGDRCLSREESPVIAIRPHAPSVTGGEVVPAGGPDDILAITVTKQLEPLPGRNFPGIGMEGTTTYAASANCGEVVRGAWARHRDSGASEGGLD